MLLVFKKFLFKPIMDLLEARRAEIEGQYDSAEDQRRLADELKADYEKRLAGIEEEMRAKITAAVKDGQAMREDIISESRTKADQILAKAQQEITREKDLALAEIRTKVTDLTLVATGKLLDEELNDQKHRKLVDKFISELDEVPR